MADKKIELTGQVWENYSYAVFADQTQGMSKGEALDVTIHSPGGSVADGFAMYDRIISLNSKGVNSTVYIPAMCYSIVTVLACGAKRVVMGPNARFVIHNAWTYEAGDHNDMRRTADELESHTKDIANVYKKRTGLAMADIRAMMDEETWLTAKEAKKLGFIDEIKSGISAQASIVSIPEEDFKKFKNAPKDLFAGSQKNSMETEKKESALQKTLNSLKDKLTGNSAKLDSLAAEKEAIEEEKETIQEDAKAALKVAEDATQQAEAATAALEVSKNEATANAKILADTNAKLTEAQNAVAKVTDELNALKVEATGILNSLNALKTVDGKALAGETAAEKLSALVAENSALVEHSKEAGKTPTPSTPSANASNATGTGAEGDEGEFKPRYKNPKNSEELLANNIAKRKWEKKQNK